MFYEVSQNNSGGYFDVDDKVCHRLFIEADSDEEARLKAEELGCYWNGVEDGIDCPCCGDRWYGVSKVDLEKLKEYSVYCYGNKSGWFKRYGKYKIVENPTLSKDLMLNSWIGKLSFSTIEEYAQYMANEYGWTTPDARIYYKDGTVKEIFKEV
jgi:hypothetical protein